MPNGPRGYGPLVQPPDPIDPMRSLSGLMSVVGGVQDFNENARRSQDIDASRKAMNEAQGDPDKAATLLDTAGRYDLSRQLRENTRKTRQTLADDAAARIGEHKSLYAQGAQLLTEVQRDPSQYPNLRPKLLELATTVDPRLATEIPDQYDPEKVKAMTQFTMDATAQMDAAHRAATVLKEKLAGEKASREDFGKDLEVVGNSLAFASNQDLWSQTQQALKHMGVSDEALALAGPMWSPTAQQRVAEMAVPAKDRDKQPNTLIGAILAAHRTGDAKAVKSLIGLNAALHASERDPQTPISQDSITAVMGNPRVWRDLRPEFRERILPALAKGGFDFKAATSTLTEDDKRVAAQWLAGRLDGLEKELAQEQPQTDEEFRAVQRQADTRKLALYNGYLAQIGQPQVSQLPADWKPGQATTPAPTPPQTPAPATAAPAPAAPALSRRQEMDGHKVGEAVKHGDAVYYIKSFTADGKAVLTKAKPNGR